MKVSHLALLTVAGLMAACDSGTTSSSDPVTPLPGTWSADTALTISGNALMLKLGLKLLADSTFTGTIRIDSVLGASIVDPVYVRSGKWSAQGSKVILTSLTCQQSASQPLPLPGTPLSAPFSINPQTGTFTANALESTTCGAPDTIATQPSKNVWQVPVQSTLAAPLGGTWNLRFVKQP